MSSQPITIRRLLAGDGDALAACFERCYGRSYVVAEFYDPRATAARVRSGRLRSVVAVTEDGEIVGHMGITIRHPRARTVDAGNSIVDPRHRGQQIVSRLAGGVVELCRDGGFLGFHHYPTTAHPIMQKLAVAGGGIESGVMLDYIPSGTEYREIEGGVRTDRPAVVVVYQPLAPTPARDVVVPRELAEPIAGIYARGNLPRTSHVATGWLPRGATRFETSSDRRRGAWRMTIERVGDDLAARVGVECAASEARVRQVDLPMAEPALGAAVDVLRQHGFFFAAVLPEYLDGDVLRLQHVASDALDLPDLVTDDARRLLRVIVEDRARAATPATRPSGR